jgi:hypothetical protein
MLNPIGKEQSKNREIVWTHFRSVHYVTHYFTYVQEVIKSNVLSGLLRT